MDLAGDNNVEVTGHVWGDKVASGFESEQQEVVVVLNSTGSQWSC